MKMFSFFLSMHSIARWGIPIIYNTPTADIPAPTMIQHPDSSYFVELYTKNFNLTLHCKAVGYQIIYNWTKNGRIINSNHHYYIIDGDLSIINMKPSDKGQYQCEVSNIGGKVESSHSQVVIKGMYCLYICTKFV